MITWALSMFELMRAILIVRSYSDDGDPDVALSRMPLEAFFKVRARILCSFMLAMTAQIIWQLP